MGSAPRPRSGPAPRASRGSSAVPTGDGGPGTVSGPVDDVHEGDVAPAVEPAVDVLSEILRRKSTAPIVENGRTWPYGKVPYYVDGVRVTREEYVAHQRAERLAELRADLGTFVASADDSPTSDDSSTSKE